jgi:hypothetical protein
MHRTASVARPRPQQRDTHRVAQLDVGHLVPVADAAPAHEPPLGSVEHGPHAEAVLVPLTGHTPQFLRGFLARPGLPLPDELQHLGIAPEGEQVVQVVRAHGAQEQSFGFQHAHGASSVRRRNLVRTDYRPAEAGTQPPGAPDDGVG